MSCLVNYERLWEQQENMKVHQFQNALLKYGVYFEEEEEEGNRMASGLDSFVNHTVSIITSDGRNFIGTLKGFDQTINIILDESHERVYSTTSGVEQVMLGLHIIRGDNVALVGLIDDDVDNRLNLANIKAEPLNPVVH